LTSRLVWTECRRGGFKPKRLDSTMVLPSNSHFSTETVNKLVDRAANLAESETLEPVA
jgi:hypothetical protein